MKLILIALLFIFAVALAQESCYCSVDDCESSSCTIVGNSAICGEAQCDESSKKKEDDYDDKNEHGHGDNNHGHENGHGHEENHEHEHEHGDHNDNDYNDGHNEHNDHNEHNGHDNNQHHPEPNHSNLILNGGFERGFFGWRRFTLNRNSFWDIQRGTNFYTAHNLPKPPQGRKAAMIASPTGAAKVFLFQDFDIRRFSDCGLIRFDLEYQYFYDNDGTGFNTTFWSSNAQYFSVDILTTNGVPLENIFITHPSSPQTTNNKYLDNRESFFYVNSINSVRYHQLRLQFSENAKNRLRVGIDDVVLTAHCIDYKHHENKNTVSITIPTASK